ncbi:MAG: protein kinase domain-containing protein [Planctomycetota bacterium]
MTDRLHQLGPYHIHGELGRGAMGVVYRARREGLDRDVALKVLPVGSTEELAARFRREAQLAARLRHPHVVGVHNVGEEHGRLYLAMDLIEGVALDTFLEEERFTAVQAAQLLVKLADAVGHAHQEGVLHRDIKPGNILLSASEKGVGVSQDTGIVPYLADFGLARAIDTAGSEKLSRSGSVLGTPAYMSPEQAQGADIDGRTDLWALGVVGYELVSNRTPFQGDSAMQMLGQVCSHDPPPLRKVAPDVPRDFEAIIHRCLEKKRDQRYRVAADLVDDLQRFLDGNPVVARRVTIARRAAAWVRRNKAIAATALVGCLGIGAVAGYAFVLKPRWEAEARATYLTTLKSTVQTAVAAHAAQLDTELRALTTAGAVDTARVEAIETAARPEAVAARVRESLPPAMRPAADDAEAQARFAQGLESYDAAPLQARAALLRGEPALAYRLDPAGDAGLEAAVLVARAMFEERRLGPAAATLRSLRSRFPERPVAKRASALLAAVLVEQGNWDQALAAAADAGAAAEVPADTLRLLQHLGTEQQRIELVRRGGLPFHYIRRAEPMRPVTLSDGRRLLLLPQRPGFPAFAVGDRGVLRPGPSPGDVLPSGTRIVDCAAGDVDGDGTVDLLCAAVRPGTGNGVLALTPDGSGWRILDLHLLPASTPAHLIPGDIDGDGTLEALVAMHWDSGEQWLVNWDAEKGALTHRPFTPGGGRLPWVRGGAVADLDADGTPELIVGTSLHTSGDGLVYHWDGAGAPQLRARFRLFEPGDFLALPDPERPGKQLLLATSEVGLHDLAHRHIAHEDAPPNDGVLFLRWDGRTMAQVHRHDVSLEDPDTTFLGNFAHGTLLGRPALAYWADRTRPDRKKVAAEGRRLRLVLGSPLATPLSLAPPRRVEAVELIDLDGDGESELVGLTAGELYVRGRRTGRPPELQLEKGEEPTTNEALQRLRAARDLAASAAHDTAQALLAEVVQRFPGSPEAAEADRLRVDARIQAARAALRNAESAIRRGTAGAEDAYAAALQQLREAAGEARDTADRYAGDLARRRRFLLQAAEAQEQALEWEAARRCLDTILHESRGSDDERSLVPRQRGLQRIQQLYGAGAALVRLSDRSAPIVATLPGRVEIQDDGGWRIGIDSHRQRGVLGIPVSWKGTAVRGRCVLEIEGSAWAAGFRVGLIPRRRHVRLHGRTYLRVWMHGVTQWDDQGVTIHLEGGASSFSPGGYSGRFELEWAYLPGANLVLLEVRDAESGAVLHRSRSGAPASLPGGDYVMGIALEDPMADAYLSHALHPWLTHVTVRDLQVWGLPGHLTVERAEPWDAEQAIEAGGGWLLRGELDEARQRFARALGRDPDAVRARLLLGLTLLRMDRRAEAARHITRALRRSPYHTLTIAEDMGRAAPAAWRRDLGRCFALALEALGSGTDAETRLARAAALSLRGDLEQADAIVTQLFAEGGDGTALRYLRRRTHWGDQKLLNEDWSWLRSRRALVPGTEPPVVCWAPIHGQPTLQSARQAMAADWRGLGAQSSLHNVMRVWVSASRVLLLEPRDPSALMVRARLGLALRKHGLAEVDLKRRAAVLRDDPNAALLVAQIYAARRGTRDTLQWLEEAARRGLDWSSVAPPTQQAFDFLQGNPRFDAFLERTGGK